MPYTVVDEWVLLGKYRLLQLDRDIECKAYAKHLINGEIYEPEYLHIHPLTGTVPLNYIAIKTTESFLGASVEFVHTHRCGKPRR